MTAADGTLGMALRERLGTSHDVTAAPTNEPLEADPTTDALVANHGAIVLLSAAHLDSGVTDDDMVDYATRRTYNLLSAAGERGVPRVVYVSSLRLMASYPDHFAVTENWQPSPDPADASQLATHLGEVVVKEFARDGLIDAIVLRVGFPVQLEPADRPVEAVGSGRSAAISVDQLVNVVDRALRAPISSWHVIHAQSPVPEPRYLMRDAAKLLGYPGAPLPTEAPRLPGT